METLTSWFMLVVKNFLLPLSIIMDKIITTPGEGKVACFLAV